jgi:hypothetical protein
MHRLYFCSRKKSKLIFQFHLSLEPYSSNTDQQNTFHALFTNVISLSTINKTIIKDKLEITYFSYSKLK